MLWDLALALAFRAVGVGGVQRADAGDVFQLELTDVGVDYNELLFVEQHAIGQAELGDLALRPAGRRPQVVTQRPPRLRRRECAGACPCGIGKTCNARKLRIGLWVI